MKHKVMLWFILLFGLVFLIGCSPEYTNVKAGASSTGISISPLYTCSGIDEQGQPLEARDIFLTTEQKIYLCGYLDPNSPIFSEFSSLKTVGFTIFWGGPNSMEPHFIDVLLAGFEI